MHEKSLAGVGEQITIFAGINILMFDFKSNIIGKLKGYKNDAHGTLSVLFFVCFPGDYVRVNRRILKLGHFCPEVSSLLPRS